MCELNEDSLDRHFASQLQMVSDVFIQSVCASHHDIIHEWLLVFYEAPTSDKYARNCLMVLMHGQLKGTGKLGKPFTDMENTKYPLEQVLARYERDNGCESLQQRKKYQVSVLDGDSNRYTEKQLSTEEKSSCDESHSTVKKKSVYELQSVKNQQLLEEVNMLHALTVENEQHYKQSDAKWQQRISQTLHTQRSQTLLLKIERNARNAIRRLKNWTPSGSPINFLLITLQDILDDEPETRSILTKLDRKLERELDNLLEQAGERREKNVRILYDQLFKQQQDLLQAKQELLQQEQAALAEARQQLQANGLTNPGSIYARPIKPNKSHQSRKSSSCNCSQCQESRKRVSPSPSRSPSPSPAPSTTHSPSPSVTVSSSSLLVHIQSNKELKSQINCCCNSCQQLRRQLSD